MNGVDIYRDADLPFFELKLCNTSYLSYKKHVHEEYSLGVVEQGESSLWYEGKTARVNPNTMVFLPPNLIHSCNPVERDNWKYMMLFIRPDWIRGFIDSKAGLLLDEPIITDMLDNKILLTINQMFKSLYSDLSPLEKETNILAVFEKALGGEEKQGKISCRLQHPKVKIIKEYLHNSFLEKVTLGQLEKVSGLNKFHIIRLFNRTFKISPHTYQTLLRINYAKKELRKDKSITEVALDAGFYDQSHFIKVFKSHIGITPDRYQKHIYQL